MTRTIQNNRYTRPLPLIQDPADGPPGGLAIQPSVKTVRTIAAREAASAVKDVIANRRNRVSVA